MLLIPAVALSVIGFAVWVGGLIFGYKGVATIGAVLIVGVGTTIMTDDLERKAGHVENQVNSSHTEVSEQTVEVDFISSFSAGLIWSLLGAAMTLQALNREGGVIS